LEGHGLLTTLGRRTSVKAARYGDRKGVASMMGMMMMGLHIAMMTPAMMHLMMAPGLMMLGL
jgi:hypothetical protein